MYKILCMYIQNNNINIITHNFSTLNGLRIFFFFFFTVLRFFSLRVHLTRECTDTLLCFKSLETALLYEFRPTNLYQIKIFFFLFYRNLIFSLFYFILLYKCGNKVYSEKSSFHSYPFFLCLFFFYASLWNFIWLLWGCIDLIHRKYTVYILNIQWMVAIIMGSINDW